jgi:hypothetical protein
MLKQGIKIFLLLFLGSCSFKKDSNKIKEESVKIIGLMEYNNVLSLINDSVNFWKLNRLQNYFENKKESVYVVDSLLCFNKNGNRLVTCLLGKTFLKPSPTGGITYFYGEKIDDHWYFFSGPFIFIPHEMKNEKNRMPFDFSELHQIALQEVYSGYLKSNGEINEAWFTNQFEGPGWGKFEDQASSDWALKGKRFKTRKEYFEFVHLEKARNNWYGVNKDSIKKLPPKNNLP